MLWFFVILISMSPSAIIQSYTIAEYLRRERIAPEKHEYRDGEILPIGGGRLEHSLIIASVISEIGNRL